MRHFHRSHSAPDSVLAIADQFFAGLGFQLVTTTARTRAFTGPLGAMKLSVRAEGGHYTFIEVVSDQMGESRMDRNVKKFFNTVHRAEDPRHALEASY